MRSLSGYAGAAAGIVAFGVAVLWPWLEPTGRRGVLLAGVVALVVQLPALWLLLRRPPERFAGPWAAGMGFRLLAVAGVAAAGLLLDGVGVAAALLALAGFLWLLLMMEAVVIWRRRPVHRAPGAGSGEPGEGDGRPARDRDDHEQPAG